MGIDGDTIGEFKKGCGISIGISGCTSVTVVEVGVSFGKSASKDIDTSYIGRGSCGGTRSSSSADSGECDTAIQDGKGGGVL